MGAKSLTHSAGQPERVREKTPRISDHKQCSNHSKIELEWVGVGAAERLGFLLCLDFIQVCFVRLFSMSLYFPFPLFLLFTAVSFFIYHTLRSIQLVR
ncbi:hypothetical protein CGI90_25655 [Vibrio parahaemolyticus]|nr:hypothetical protein [Vibrio parahaemolyticus]TOH00394.1 hypothetical protein CGI90_25655 [Vibrio parahaemolyticus]